MEDKSTDTWVNYKLLASVKKMKAKFKGIYILWTLPKVSLSPVSASMAHMLHIRPSHFVDPFLRL